MKTDLPFKKFDDYLFKQCINSVRNPCALISINGVILICNEALTELVSDNTGEEKLIHNNELRGMNYTDITASGDWGRFILHERILQFNKCVNEKIRTTFTDVNRNKIFSGSFNPIFDHGEKLHSVFANLEIVNEQRFTELKKNLMYFSFKEILFLQQIVSYLSMNEIYKIKENFRTFYQLNLSENIKKTIDRELQSNSGFFNRSEYLNRINTKIIRNRINLHEFMLSMFIFREQLSEDFFT